MHDTPSLSLVARVPSVHERAWNALIPKRAIGIEVVPNIGVRYLHPTKGYRMVDKKRFAVRGVL